MGLGYKALGLMLIGFGLTDCHRLAGLGLWVLACGAFRV